ncbi:hypothetical protein HRW23_17510 [Streptomyces lunaelactis]|uniref:hypothetical protein n=2 Tax=Streptomyces lunaelactis TaxID=1535768 RepID=UPI001585524F|nr:hypothetical protein [Streptomyces lunaelactis]NUK09326.1 hypothetical protein [Streptomyces lunaelactis]NUK53582.1 hypothetical protein [Streptomyces lunaelactis]NUK65287.1 hypothetical protein [Streptomyces lunaelactis]NUK73162.1 hypothetical protein [Streptomyces lunaelactis]NUK79164.1 hypothetical protein [Streptomyces lunaelactis]
MSDREQQRWGQPGAGWDAPYPGPPPRKRRKWPWVLLVVVLLLAGGCVAVFSAFVNEVSKTVRVTYEVTGNAKDVAIAYSTWQGGDELTSQESSRTLPWRKVLEDEGFLKGGSLVVTLGPEGGTATCSVTVDDEAPKKATASGPFATASCTGF